VGFGFVVKLGQLANSPEVRHLYCTCVTHGPKKPSISAKVTSLQSVSIVLQLQKEVFHLK